MPQGSDEMWVAHLQVNDFVERITFKENQLSGSFTFRRHWCCRQYHPVICRKNTGFDPKYFLGHLTYFQASANSDEIIHGAL